MQKQLYILTSKFFLTGLIIAWMVLPTIATSQPVVNIGSVTSCSEEVVIPINVKNFTNIAAITLYIGVDTDIIEYVGIEDIDDAFSSGNFVGGVSIEDHLITLSWMSLTAATIDSGVMCGIRISQKADSVNFNFRSNCEIANSDLIIIDNVEYEDGTLIALDSFILNPDSQSVLEGDTVTFELFDIPTNVFCQWQQYVDNSWTNIQDAPPYFGVQTSTLVIKSTSVDMNNTTFRCLLSNDVCSVGSNSSLLLVTPNSIGKLESFEKSAVLEVFPNPVDTQFNCRFNVNVQRGVLKLVNSGGKEMFYSEIQNVSAGDQILVDADSLKTGVYVLQLLVNNRLMSSVKIIRK